MLGQTQTSWLPRWEVYELPHTRGTDAPALAVPKDGRGVPLILWAGWYRKYGDVYFRTMLHSGYLSLLDLEIIGAGLEKPCAWKNPVPEDAVDPFEDRVAIPESLKPGDNRIAVEPEDGPVSDPGEGDGAHVSTGAPLLRTPPRGGRGSGGAHPRSDDRDGVLPSFDPTAGPAKLHRGPHRLAHRGHRPGLRRGQGRVRRHVLGREAGPGVRRARLRARRPPCGPSPRRWSRALRSRPPGRAWGSRRRGAASSAKRSGGG